MQSWIFNNTHQYVYIRACGLLKNTRMLLRSTRRAASAIVTCMFGLRFYQEQFSSYQWTMVIKRRFIITVSMDITTGIVIILYFLSSVSFVITTDRGQDSDFWSAFENSAKGSSETVLVLPYLGQTKGVKKCSLQEIFTSSLLNLIQSTSTETSVNLIYFNEENVFKVYNVCNVTDRKSYLLSNISRYCTWREIA